jgi:hypothetical protein
MIEPRPIYPKHFLSERVSRRNTGFILMPFSDDFELVHEAIREGINSSRLEPLRADDIFSTRSGMEKILRGIAEAEVVVADMTGRNANVFYEAGIAHTIKDNVVLLTQDIDDIPFDFRHIDHIEYTPTDGGLKALTDELSQVIANLPSEPTPPATPIQPPSATASTPSEVRRAIRTQLRICDQRWVEEVVPTQAQVFQDQFGEVLQTRRTDSEWAEIKKQVISTLQPAFLSSWEPVEELGFQVIEEGLRLESELPELARALERAYSLGDRLETRAHPSVVGQGPLLTLRTWTLWGAFALDSRNWKAAGDLLHRVVNFDQERRPLAQHRHIHYPEGAGLGAGDRSADLAVWSINEYADNAQFFGDLEMMKGFIGLWLFAVNLSYSLESDSFFDFFPSWRLAPFQPFSSLVSLLETDPDFARNFTTTVANQQPSELNEAWVSGLRSKLQSSARGYFRWPGQHELPQRFAE